VDKLKGLYDNDNARLEILEAIRVLRKYDLFSALLWEYSAKTKQSFNSGDTEPLALLSSWTMGFRSCLEKVNNPFFDFKPTEKEKKEKK